MAVHFDVDNGVAVITLDRPEVRNAVDRETALAVSSAVQTVEKDDAIRVAILTGAGGNFCTGMDLKAFLRGEVIRLPEGFGGFTQAKTTKPFIAAVEGYALAGGFEMALACDLIIASEEARFGLTEVKRGLVANAGGLVRLPRQIPAKIASELVLTGELFLAPRLAAFGLINRLAAAGEALSAASDIARQIAANGPLAVAASRRVLAESQDWPTHEMFERQNEITRPIFASADAREGAAAFSEKRAPQWRGN
jgi:enoyl-CoA hydratase